MIYLIGTTHELQHNGLGSVDEISRNKFASYLERLTTEYGASLIAEEFNEEALRKSNATLGTLKCIADKLKVKHIFCDPDTKERKRIGIPSREKIKSSLGIQGAVYENSVEDKQIKEEQKKYHQIREKFWFSKIEKFTDGVVIFVCGQDHVESFASLLIDNRCGIKILNSSLQDTKGR